MSRYFSDNATHITRAQQLWPMLIAAATERRIVTYGMLCDLIGIKVAVSLTDPLFYIKHWCEVNNLPPLTVIVVNKDSGRPGSGLTLDDMDKSREDVFTYAWYRIVPPTADELKEAYKTPHSKA